MRPAVLTSETYNVAVFAGTNSDQIEESLTEKPLQIVHLYKTNLKFPPMGLMFMANVSCITSISCGWYNHKGTAGMK